jgi:FkbM family methyltransferase
MIEFIKKILEKVNAAKTIYMKRSFGDWRYPLFTVVWGLVKVLTIRKNVHVNGIRFNLSCNNWITHFRWYLFNKKEPEVRMYIDENLNNEDVFFDIGANVGVFTIYAAKRHPGLKIYSFEPEISNLCLLKENIIHNNILDRVKTYGVAISDFVGLSELHIQDFEEGSAMHAESTNYLSKTDEGYNVVWSEGVAAVTLDHICQQLGVVPNGMKIDTDGNELKILNGAKNTLKNKDFRSMIIEIPKNGIKRSACIEILQNNGFIIKWEDKDKTINQIWARKQ